MFYPQLFKSSTRRLYGLGLLGIALLISGCSKHQNTDSQAFDIHDYQGKWVVLNYWAQWCGPCVEEIPELNELSNQYPNQLIVLGINFDHIAGDKLVQLQKQMGIEYLNLAQDPADQLRLSRPAGLPTTYIFNRSGKLDSKLVGPQTLNSILKRTDINNTAIE